VIRRVEFVSDRMSYIIFRGCWCSIIFLNLHAPGEDKSGDVKDSFCEEVGHVNDQFPRHCMTILLGDFNAKVGRKKFSNQQLQMRIHTKLAMIMELEW
jgi:hypothetical protein